MKVYQHKVHYYETDKMGFVHHSNYVRWFEEARDDYFNQTDVPYTVAKAFKLESDFETRLFRLCFVKILINPIAYARQ